MEKSANFIQLLSALQGQPLPEPAVLAGYTAIIHILEIAVPLPDKRAIISQKNRRYDEGCWAVYPSTHLSAIEDDCSEMEALHKQLVFALKYEGVNLLVFKQLIYHYGLARLNDLVAISPTGQYTRRIWFLIEWLSGERLARPGLVKRSYVKVVDDALQYAVAGEKSPRHQVLNNLPGTVGFCPLVRKTAKLEAYISSNLSAQQDHYLKDLRTDILRRASAFLLLKDSKASFAIEGESPRSQRAARWGRAIGRAGERALSEAELLSLQKLVIENPRFLKLGYRTQGGFVGEHDPATGQPMPDHISARWQDLDTLMEGLLATNSYLLDSELDPVVSAAVIAFGFVFIHPFADGNGRIHRYLIHHVLARKGFTKQGIIFPVSVAILGQMGAYRDTLEAYSLPLLDFISWQENADHNVDVLNDTQDFYRYFDATRQAEFLYDCVYETLKHTLPKEVAYLSRYDTFRAAVQRQLDMPDKLIALLVRFLEQHEGKLSKRARSKEFRDLTEAEAVYLEEAFREAFN